MSKIDDPKILSNLVPTSQDIIDKQNDENELNDQNQMFNISFYKRSFSAEGNGKRLSKFRIIMRNEMNEQSKSQMREYEIWQKKTTKIALKKYSSAFPKDFFVNVKKSSDNLQYKDHTATNAQKIYAENQSSYKFLEQHQLKDFQNNFSKNHHKLVSQQVNQQNECFPIENINTQKQVNGMFKQKNQMQSLSKFLQIQNSLNQQLIQYNSKQRCQSEADSLLKRTVCDIQDSKNQFDIIQQNENKQDLQQKELKSIQEQQTIQQLKQHQQSNFNKLFSKNENYNIQSAQQNGNNLKFKETISHNLSALYSDSSNQKFQSQINYSHSSQSHRKKPISGHSKVYCQTEQNEDSLKQNSDDNINQLNQSINQNDTPKFISNEQSNSLNSIPAKQKRPSSFTAAVMQQLMYGYSQQSTLPGTIQQNQARNIYTKQNLSSDKKQVEKDNKSINNNEQLSPTQIKQKRKNLPIRSQSEQKLQNESTSLSSNLGMTQILPQNLKFNKSNCKSDNKSKLEVPINHRIECQSAPEHKDNLNYATFSSAIKNTFMKLDQNNNKNQNKIQSFDDKSFVNQLEVNKVNSNEQIYQCLNKPENVDKIFLNHNQSYLDINNKVQENQQIEFQQNKQIKKLNDSKSQQNSNCEYIIIGNQKCLKKYNNYNNRCKTEECKQDLNDNLSDQKNNIFIKLSHETNNLDKHRDNKKSSQRYINSDKKVISENSDKLKQNVQNDTNIESYSNEFMEDNYLKPMERERKTNNDGQIKISRRRSNISTPIKSFPYKNKKNSDDNSEEFFSSQNLHSDDNQKSSNQTESCHNIDYERRLDSISSFSQLLLSDQQQQNKELVDQKKRVRRPKSYHSQQIFNINSNENTKKTHRIQRKSILNKSSVEESTNKDNQATLECDSSINKNININNQFQKGQNLTTEKMFEQSIMNMINNGQNQNNKQNADIKQSYEQNPSNRNTILPKISSNQNSNMHKNIIKAQLNNKIYSISIHKNKNDDSPNDSDSVYTPSSSNDNSGSKRASIQNNQQNIQKLSKFQQSKEKQRYENSFDNEIKQQTKQEILTQQNQNQMQPTQNKANSFLQSNISQNLFEFSFRHINQKETENIVYKQTENNKLNQCNQSQEQKMICYSNLNRYEQQDNNLKHYNIKLNLSKQVNSKDSSNSKLSSSDLKLTTKFLCDKKQTLKTDAS